eukprot:m.163931 g.163931  ORF g.163931 m.163931 type:complete len:1923 (+) comp10310_c0_seq1:2263-8031(+)
MPPWFRLPADLVETIVDFVTVEFLSGDQILMRPACSALPVAESHLYYVATISTPIRLSFMGMSITLPLEQSDRQSLCAVADVCGVTVGATAMYQLPAAWLPADHPVSLLMESGGWSTSLTGMGYSLTRDLRLKPVVQFWDGIGSTKFDYDVAPGNIWARGTLSRTIPTPGITDLLVPNLLRLAMTFDGEFMAGVGDLSKRFEDMFIGSWELLANGRMSIVLSMPLFTDSAWTWTGLGSAVLSVQIGGQSQRSQCTSSKNPEGLYISATGQIPSIGPFFFPTLSIEFQMYIIFAFADRPKSSQEQAREAALVETFLQELRTFASNNAGLTATDMADGIEAALAVADVEGNEALAGLVAYVRPELEFFIRQLRNEVAHDLTEESTAALLSRLADTFESKRTTSTIPTSNAEAGIDAVGFRLARSMGNGGKSCLFTVLCMDIESSTEFGSAPALQRCGDTDAEIFDPLPQDELLVYQHGRLSRNFHLLDFLTLSSDATVDYAYSPSSLMFTYRTLSNVRFLGASATAKFYATRQRIEWSYSAELFNLAFASVSYGITVASPELTKRNLKTATLFAEGQFVTQSGKRDLIDAITRKIVDFLQDAVLFAEERKRLQEAAVRTAKEVVANAREGARFAGAVVESVAGTIGDLEDQLRGYEDEILNLMDPSNFDGAVKAAKQKARELCPSSAFSGLCGDICVFCVPDVRRRRAVDGRAALQRKRRIIGAIVDGLSSLKDGFESVGDGLVKVGGAIYEEGSRITELAADTIKDLQKYGLDKIYEQAAELKDAALDTISDVVKDFLPDCECKLYAPNPACEIGDAVCEGAILAVSEAMSKVSSVMAFATKRLKTVTDFARNLRDQISVKKVATFANEQAQATLDKAEELANTGLDAAEDGLQKVLDMFGDLLALAGQALSKVISIKSITFAFQQKVSERTPEVLRLNIVTEKGGIRETFEVDFDFMDFSSSVFNVAKAIFAKYFATASSIVGRRREVSGTTDLPPIPSQDFFTAKCALGWQTLLAFSDMFSGLDTVHAQALSDLAALITYLEDLQAQIDDFSSVNLNTGAFDEPITGEGSEFNQFNSSTLDLSLDGLQDSITTSLAYESFLLQLKTTAQVQGAQIQLTVDHGFNVWRADMMSRFAGVEANSTGCVSFADCVLANLQTFVETFTQSPIPEERLAAMAANNTRLLEIGMSLGADDLSLINAMLLVREAERMMTAALQDGSLLCGEAPTITSTFDASYVELLDSRFSLTCEAAGDPSPALYWVEAEFPDVTVSNSSVLRWDHLPAEAGGKSYQCIAQNHIGTAKSELVQLVVQGRSAPVPQVTYQFDVSGLPELATNETVADLFAATMLREVSSQLGIWTDLLVDLTVSSDGVVVHGIARMTDEEALTLGNSTAEELQLEALANLRALVINDVLTVTFQGVTYRLIGVTFEQVECPVPCALVEPDAVFGNACDLATYEVEFSEYVCEWSTHTLQNMGPTCKDVHALSNFAENAPYCRRINDPPIIVDADLLEVVLVPEDKLPGLLLFDFSVFDTERERQNVTATLLSNDEDSMELLSIDMWLYELRLARNISFEDFPTQDLCVVLRLTDTGEPVMYQDYELCIRMVDVNEIPLSISVGGTDFSIEENLEPGAVIASLSGVDPDFDQELTFSIVETDGYFAVDGNNLVAGETNINFEATPNLTVTIRATDNGSPVLSLDRSYLFTIEDINDIPVFRLLDCGTCDTMTKPFAARKGGIFARVFVWDDEVWQNHTVMVGNVTSDTDWSNNEAFSIRSRQDTVAMTDDASMQVSERYNGSSLYLWSPLPANVTSVTFEISVSDNGSPPQRRTSSFTVAVVAPSSSASRLTDSEIAGISVSVTFFIVAVVFTAVLVRAHYRQKQIKKRVHSENKLDTIISSMPNISGELDSDGQQRPTVKRQSWIEMIN